MSKGSPKGGKKPIFIASLGTETNTFSPVPTGLSSFEEMRISRGNGSISNARGVGGFLRPYRQLAEADGRLVVESISAFAQPGGVTIQSVYELLRDQILEDLRGAGDLGFVLLGLHGAMIASACDDCEGDLIKRARDIVGYSVPIGVELDPHCHLTELMRTNASVIIAMKQYPHIDWADRARELYSICSRLERREINPVSAAFDCRMVGFYPTTLEPMASIVAQLHEAEQEEDILSASLIHGFPYGDHADTGMQVLVVADGDMERARSVARRIGVSIYKQRRELSPGMPLLAEALKIAQSLEGRIVLADTSDNPGGGAPGDTTYMLRGLLEAKLGPSALGTIYDPGAVRICEEAGVGARLRIRLGGKLCVSSGNPFDVDVKVMSLSPDHIQSGRSITRLGASAWVRIEDVDVVISSIRAQVFGLTAFTNIGIDLGNKKVIAVKSLEHFRAEFVKVADHIVTVDTPGALQRNFGSIPYYRKRDMEFYPRVIDPLLLDG